MLKKGARCRIRAPSVVSSVDYNTFTIKWYCKYIFLRQPSQKYSDAIFNKILTAQRLTLSVRSVL